MRPRYTPRRLAILLAFFLITFALMAWYVIGNLARARRDGPRPSAQQNARQPAPPRENLPPSNAQ